ncbi:unnamed protein product [Protopolystoma xenopodis]|uniref:Uncharacterized protein n=1 Tax=Protopolystoma xenopodis TaxID=117903 RepID=A0A3S5FE36_9PLAT|nr:unnamed protein product [Protopolystoma xenopodis]
MYENGAAVVSRLNGLEAIGQALETRPTSFWPKGAQDTSLIGLPADSGGSADWLPDSLQLGNWTVEHMTKTKAPNSLVVLSLLHSLMFISQKV